MQKSTYRLKLSSRRFIYLYWICADQFMRTQQFFRTVILHINCFFLTEDEDQAQLDFVYDQADHVSTANKEFIHIQRILVCSLTLIPDFFCCFKYLPE